MTAKVEKALTTITRDIEQYQVSTIDFCGKQITAEVDDDSNSLIITIQDNYSIDNFILDNQFDLIDVLEELEHNDY